MLSALKNPRVNQIKSRAPDLEVLHHASSAELRLLRKTRIRNREGSAGLLVVLILVLVGIAAFLVLELSPQSGMQPPTNVGLAPTAAPSGNSASRASSTGISAPSADVFQVERRAGQGPDPAKDSNRFLGTGSLRGFIQTGLDIPFPEVWTLVIEPSKMLIGSDKAVSQRVEITGGEDEFEVTGLPLAGYSLRGEADGLNGSTVNVLLERTSSSAYVALELSPAGFITGNLVDFEDAALEGIEVWLLRTSGTGLGASQTGARKTMTGADGTWRFTDVLDGPYALTFGSLEAPLIPPSALTFRAPSLTWPAPDLPPLAMLTVTVLDDAGNPVGGARVRGSGTMGGAIDVKTTSNGQAILRHLQPGRYRLHADHDAYGEGFVQRRFEGGEKDQVTLTLTRRF